VRQGVLDALPPPRAEGRQGRNLLAALLHGAVPGWPRLVPRPSFHGIHCRVPLLGDLGRRLGSRGGEAARRQWERVRLPGVAIRALHRGPWLDRGLSRRHPCLGLCGVRSRVWPVLEAGEGLRGFGERRLCLPHGPAHGQRLAA
jgi:hypothetical protein